MLSIRKTSARSVANKKEIENKNGEQSIYLYGDIGGYWGINEQEWINEFNNLTASKIHLRINSDGGDIFAARAMKTAIQQHNSTVIAHVDGLAASAASFLMLGANEIEIVDGGFIMVHKAMGLLDILGYFNEDDLQELIDQLVEEKKRHTKFNESIANDYAKKTGKSIAEAISWMAGETWFTAQEALSVGLVDRIYDGEPLEGHFDLSVFENPPEAVKNRTTIDVKRTVEKAIREVGLTSAVAKSILKKGYSIEEIARDAEFQNSQKKKTIPSKGKDDQREVDSDGNEFENLDQTAKLLARGNAILKR